ncbi:MAG TPA: FmdB family zinc ribbon protein [Ramlibacter sp.]|jgi:putative FmdB family regulatory protein|nr:FmdB family zinc ribbon protein [Ramlibacter sp.]
MPIYAYKCQSCGHAKDVLQKISDPPLTVCPACGAPAFSKQVTAAGFQLKGSGWYATDFKGGSSAPAPAAEGGKPADAAKPADGAKPGESGKTSDSKPAESGTTASKPKPDAPAASAGVRGGACACH